MQRGWMMGAGLAGLLVGFSAGFWTGDWATTAGDSRPAANLRAWVGEPPVVVIDHDAVLLAKVGKGGVTARQFIEAASHRVSIHDGVLPLEERRAILDELIRDEALWQVSVDELLFADERVRPTMVNLLIRDRVHSEVRQTDYDEAELRAYFDANPEDFLVPERVKVSRIFTAVGEDEDSTDAQRRSARLHAQVADHPERFSSVAFEHSEDGYRRRGGDLGYVSSEGKPGVPPEVIEHAFGMEVGDISDPFLAGGGFNILMLVAEREEKIRTFDMMKGSVIRKLKHERVSEKTRALVESVMESRTVEVDEAALARLDLTARLGPAGVALEVPDATEESP